MTAPTPPRLTLERIDTRVLSVPLRRPIVGKVGEYSHWPFILVDVVTKEGIVGHGYLEPYHASATRSITALIDDMATQQRGKPIAPFDRFGEAIAEVRRAVGDDIVLMSDFNQGQSLTSALRLLHALDDQGLEWFEEPIVFDDYAGCARLANELKTPVSIGENIFGPRDFLHAVQAGAADCYMPDLMRIGGVTGWLRAAAIAGAANLPLSSHLYPEFSAHLLRVSESADWLEWRDWGNPFLAEPFPVRQGAIHLPDRPGAGIAWDEAAVEKFSV